MCELMAMSFAKPIVAKVSIQAFSQRSVENADGWGLGWYPDRSLALVKQPARWSAQHTQFLENYPGLLSCLYIAHVRHRTVGAVPTHSDTHPFHRELNGRDYCFAHNGTLEGDFWHRPLGRFRPVGGTDSEQLFCLLLNELDEFAHLSMALENARQVSNGDGKSTKVQVQASTEQQWKWLHKLLLRLNDFGKLNCLLTDGDRLLAYHDKFGWKGLAYRNVFMHQETEQYLGDSTLAVSFHSDLVNHGCIIATNPLSPEGWQPFLPGEMKLLHRGDITYSSRAPVQETTVPSRNGTASASNHSCVQVAAGSS